jgi:2-(1,2-epoxy-1,2-dihydrophenyl)acetyl-CoA isomerase
MSYTDLVFERRGAVAVLTFNRPEKLNALGRDLQADIHAAAAEARNDDSIRAVVWTGAGRGFCSGADLTSGVSPDASPSQNERLDELGWVGRLATTMYTLDKPTIAAVNGVAAGAGMSIALACDMRVGNKNSRFKTVFIERSLSPDSGMSFFLPRIVGYSRAADLIMTSRAVGADEAYRLGLLDRLVEGEGDNLVDAAVALAEEVGKWPPVAMRSAKRVLQHNLQVDLQEALKYEYAGLQYARRAPHDVNESRLSFLEKRPPVYTGE